MSKGVSAVLGVFLSLLPMILTTVAVVCLLPDTIPMHFNGQGEIDARAPKTKEFLAAGIIFGCNLLMTILGVFAEPICASGLSTGTSNPRKMRILLLAVILFMDLVFAGILGYQLYLCNTLPL